MLVVLFLFLIAHYFLGLPFYWRDNLASLFFLSGLGLHRGDYYFGLGNNHPSWFVSCLIVSEVLFYSIYFILRDKPVSRNLVVFLIFLVAAYAVFRNQDLFISYSLWRAILGMSLGFFASRLYRFSYIWFQRNSSNNSKVEFLIISVTEILIATWLIHDLCFHVGGSYNILQLLFIFSIFLVLMCLKKGIVSCFLGRRSFSIFGKLALPLYLSHAFVLEISLKFYYVNISTQDNTFLITPIFMSVAFAVLLHWFMKLVSKKIGSHKNDKHKKYKMGL